MTKKNSMDNYGIQRSINTGKVYSLPDGLNIYEEIIYELDLEDLQEHEENLEEIIDIPVNHRSIERELPLTAKISDRNLPHRLNKGLRTIFHEE